MYSALWPVVAIAPQNQLGTSYGFMQAIQNLGLAITANVTGMLIGFEGYIYVEMFLIL